MLPYILSLLVYGSITLLGNGFFPCCPEHRSWNKWQFSHIISIPLDVTVGAWEKLIKCTQGWGLW